MCYAIAFSYDFIDLLTKGSNMYEVNTFTIWQRKIHIYHSNHSSNKNQSNILLLLVLRLEAAKSPFQRISPRHQVNTAGTISIVFTSFIVCQVCEDFQL